ncbi:lysine/ornithine N-monooxygenase [Rhodococcus sp. BE178]
MVDIELINELYATEYRERVRGERRLFMRRASEIDGVREVEDGIEVSVRSAVDGLTDTLTCDALILATGFSAAPLESLFGSSLPEVSVDRGVGRDYRLEVGPGVRGGIYLQGGIEKTHGLTASLLSDVAVRAGEILNSILAHRDLGGSLARLNADNPYATSEVR